MSNRRFLGLSVGIGLLASSALILTAIMLALPHERNAWSSSDAPTSVLTWTYIVEILLLGTGATLAVSAITYVRGRRPRVADDTPLFRERAYYGAVVLLVPLIAALTDSEPRSKTLLWGAVILLGGTFAVRELLIRRVYEGHFV